MTKPNEVSEFQVYKYLLHQHVIAHLDAYIDQEMTDGGGVPFVSKTLDERFKDFILFYATTFGYVELEG